MTKFNTLQADALALDGHGRLVIKAIALGDFNMLSRCDYKIFHNDEENKTSANRISFPISVRPESERNPPKKERRRGQPLKVEKTADAVKET